MANAAYQLFAQQYYREYSRSVHHIKLATRISVTHEASFNSLKLGQCGLCDFHAAASPDHLSPSED
jgi:hypothetical protein